MGKSAEKKNNYNLMASIWLGEKATNAAKRRTPSLPNRTLNDRRLVGFRLSKQVILRQQKEKQLTRYRRSTNAQK